jgi:hypothetical protein
MNESYQFSRDARVDKNVACFSSLLSQSAQNVALHTLVLHRASAINRCRSPFSLTVKEINGLSVLYRNAVQSRNALCKDPRIEMHNKILFPYRRMLLVKEAVYGDQEHANRVEDHITNKKSLFGM